MTCFTVNGVPSETVYQRLKNEFGIHVKHSTEGFPPGAQGNVRLSPSYYNTPQEFRALGQALSQIAGLYTTEDLVI